MSVPCLIRKTSYLRRPEKTKKGQDDALTPKVVEGVGFEPTRRCLQTVFKNTPLVLGMLKNRNMLLHLKANKGVAGFLLANGALGDSDTLEIRKRLIQNDKVEAIIILPRELFITTDISVTLWILNQNKKGGEYHGRNLRNRENEILFMDLRTWTDDPVKNEGKKKVRLTDEQIRRAADIYHTWQNEGTDGTKYAVPELYRSVGIAEIEKQGWSLVPSMYIEFIDHDLDIDFNAEMSRIQAEMRDVLAQEKQSQKMLEDAFRGIGYGL